MLVLINCPVCGTELKPRSLEGHLESVHEIPEEVTVRIRLHPTQAYTITPILIDQPEPEPEKEPETEPEE